MTGLITWIARGPHFPVTGNEENEVSVVVEPEQFGKSDSVEIVWIHVEVGQFRGVDALLWEDWEVAD